MSKEITITLQIREGCSTAATLRHLYHQLDEFDPEFELDGEPVSFSYGDHDEDDELDRVIVKL